MERTARICWSRSTLMQACNLATIFLQDQKMPQLPFHFSSCGECWLRRVLVKLSAPRATWFSTRRRLGKLQIVQIFIWVLLYVDEELCDISAFSFQATVPERVETGFLSCHFVLKVRSCTTFCNYCKIFYLHLHSILYIYFEDLREYWEPSRFS